MKSALLITSLAITACSESEAGKGKTTELTDRDKVVIGILVGNLDDSRSIYAGAFDEMPTGEIDLGSLRELPDGFLHLYDDTILHADFESQELSRFDIAADNTLVQGARMGLSDYGLPSLRTKPILFSKTRAYYLDDANGRIIVFDPSTMLIEETKEAPELVEGAWRSYFGYPRKSGDRYLVPFSRYDADYTSIAPYVAVAILKDDPAAPVQVIQDTRCAGSVISFVDERGDLYVLGDNGGGQFDFYQQQQLPPACVLRVKSGEDRFDPDYYVDVYQLTGAPAVQGLWYLDGRSFMLQAWANEQGRAALETDDDFWLGENFDWVTVNLANESVTPLTGLPRSAPYSLVEFRVGTQAYLQRFVASADADHAELYAVRNGRADKVLETTGEFWALGRVRAAKAAE